MENYVDNKMLKQNKKVKLTVFYKLKFEKNYF